MYRFQKDEHEDVSDKEEKKRAGIIRKHPGRYYTYKMMFDILKHSSEEKNIERHSFLLKAKQLNQDGFILKSRTPDAIKRKDGKNTDGSESKGRRRVDDGKSNRKIIEAFNDFIHHSILQNELDFAIEALEANIPNFREKDLLYKEDHEEKGLLYHCNIMELEKYVFDIFNDVIPSYDDTDVSSMLLIDATLSLIRISMRCIDRQITTSIDQYPIEKVRRARVKLPNLKCHAIPNESFDDVGKRNNKASARNTSIEGGIKENLPKFSLPLGTVETLLFQDNFTIYSSSIFNEVLAGVSPEEEGEIEIREDRAEDSLNRKKHRDERKDQDQSQVYLGYDLYYI